MTPVPRRALIVSATIGEGHNSAGRALQEAVERIWPGCEVGWLDTLSVLGPGVGPVARASYVSQIRHLPWMYEFFFSATRRRQWPLLATRRLIGSWCGRRMAPRIREFAPDVIISTYPLGSAGLSWLRQHRTLDVPVGAWVPAFWPHPYWLYRNLDITYVMHPQAVPIAARAEPGVRVAVGALPVRDAFAPGDRTAARARLGISDNSFVATVSTGSFAFGRVDAAVTALLAAGPQVQVVAICGRNDRLRAQLSTSGEPPGRLRVVGWTDDMPSWITASDVVVANAGGATGLEALACAVPLIMFQPIAGHGKANAALMTSAGVAVLAWSPAELTAVVRRLAADPAERADLERALQAGQGHRRPEDDLADLAAMGGHGPGPLLPVRAGDALFAHVHSKTVPQQVGAVVMLNEPGTDLASLRAAVGRAAGQIPHLRRRLAPKPSRLGRDRWLIDESIDVRSRITEVTLGADGTPGSLEEVVGDFFAAPVDPSAAAWQMLLVPGLPPAPGGQSAVVVKIHHALGDSYALISLLAGLLDPPTGPAARPAPPRTVRGNARRAAAGRAVRTLRVVRGLVGMMLDGGTRPTGVPGATTGRRREFAAVSLDSRAVTITARRLGVSPADLVLAVTAEALGRQMAACGEPTERTIRVMVPRTLRTTGRVLRGQPSGARPRGRARDARPPANRTAGVLLELPVDPMSLADRAAATRTMRQARMRRGDAEATAFVLGAMNVLPAPLQRAFARAVYTSRRFNLIVSIFPGLRRTRHLLGAEIATVYPVLALADGVGLAVGAMAWGRSMSIGLLADPALTQGVALLAEDIGQAFAAGERLASAPPADGPADALPADAGPADAVPADAVPADAGPADGSFAEPGGPARQAG
jgi:diacylglycerol O-acyltransferase